MRTPKRSSRGLTLVEVVFASLLFAVVGSAILGFLGATAQGGQARRRISDPALESVLALRRFRTAAPEFRTTLAADNTQALLWLHDLVPSRSVHTSELGVLRFDEEERVLLLEFPSSAELAGDRSLEREFRANRPDDMLDAMDALRDDEMLVRVIVAEGIDEVLFMEEASNPAAMRLEFVVEGQTTELLLAPQRPQEPLR
ncbi:MAG: hypothetical protein GC172_12180 [Phycisphaera sp.]|nr:hypothetical protein [Phycisphaera sp.]